MPPKVPLLLLLPLQLLLPREGLDGRRLQLRAPGTSRRAVDRFGDSPPALLRSGGRGLLGVLRLLGAGLLGRGTAASLSAAGAAAVAAAAAVFPASRLRGSGPLLLASAPSAPDPAP